MKIMSELEPLSLTQTIEKVDTLINSGNGDTGRLYHILEFLKNNKPLYSSDQTYLENKLNSSFRVVSEIKEEDESLPKIQELINSGKGDPGRLQHIYDTAANDKPLYHSDVEYLQSKLSPNTSIITKIEQPLEIREYASTPKTNPALIVSESNNQSNVLESPPVHDTAELTTLSESIAVEEDTIKQQKIISDEIVSNREKLTKLISHRKEYEQKVIREKSSLELQIQEERLRIETQTKISKDILSQKDQLAKIKKEQVGIIKKINSKKLKISNDLAEQKRQLVQTQLEQEKIEKQIQNEQLLLAQMTSEQKTRLDSQAAIAHEIKSKQDELEKSKRDYDEIISQIHEEKMKFAESSN